MYGALVDICNVAGGLFFLHCASFTLNFPRIAQVNNSITYKILDRRVARNFFEFREKK